MNDPFAPTIYPAWRLVDLFLITGLVVLLLLIGLAPVVLFLQPAEGEITLALSLSAIVVQGVSFLGGLVGVGLYRQVEWRKMGWVNMPLYWWGASLVLGVLSLPLMSSIGLAVQLAWQTEWVNPQTELIMPEGFSWGGMIGMAIGVGLLIPLAEEAIFRGVVFYWLRQKSSFWVAAGVSSLAFGLIHADPLISTSTTVLGLLCAIAYEKSGSIWGAVTIHAVNNLLAVILSYLMLWLTNTA